MSNGMAFNDFAKVLSGWTRNVIDTAITDSGSTTTRFRLKDRYFQPDQFNGYLLQFITGERAGAVYKIAGNGNTYIDVTAPIAAYTPPEDVKLAILNVNAGASFVDVVKWGNQYLTGADITQNILNLDVALTEILGASPNYTLADNEDISAGKTFTVTEEYKWRNTSLYLRTNGAIDISLEFAPEGSDFYEPEESPLVFSTAGTNIYEINFAWKAIRITGSNSSNVTAKLKGLT